MVTLLFLPSCAPLLPLQTEPVFAPSSAEALPEFFTVVTWTRVATGLTRVSFG